MRRASVDEDCVASTRVKLRAACMYNFDPVEIGKIPARALSQILVNLNANHVAARAYDFRHDRRVIAYAASYVKNSIACLKLQSINPHGKAARLPVVQLALRVNRYEYVVIKMTWVVIRSRAIASSALDARHRRDCLPRIRIRNLPRPRP